MQTIKIQHQGEGQRIRQTDDEITILRDGDHEFDALCHDLEKAHQEAMENTVGGKGYESPRAIICYETPECAHRAYMNEGDRAWIMNANGKTVASV